MQEPFVAPCTYKGGWTAVRLQINEVPVPQVM